MVSKSAGETIFLDFRRLGMSDRLAIRVERGEEGVASSEMRKQYIALASPEP